MLFFFQIIIIFFGGGGGGGLGRKLPRLFKKVIVTKFGMNNVIYKAVSLTWPASMKMYQGKRVFTYEKVQLPQDWLGNEHPGRFVVSGHQYLQYGRTELIY